MDVNQEKGSAQESHHTVGNYELKETIGEGAFAKVKCAVHILTGQKVLTC
jgi:serine/threonine protein kinase